MTGPAGPAALEAVVLISANATNHNHVRMFSDLRAAFERAGLEAQLFLPEIRNPDLGPFLDCLNRNRHRADRVLVIDYNARMQMRETFAFQRLSVLIDHPYQHVARLRRLPPHGVVSYIDRGTPRFLDWMGLPNRSFFLPHAASPPVETLPWSNRDIDILAVGRLGGSPRFADLEAQVAGAPQPLPNIICDFAERILAGEDITDALTTAAADHAFDLSLLDDESLFEVVRVAASWLERKRRHDVLNALVGLPVTVIGGVDDGFFDREPEGFTFLGPKPFEEALTAMGRSKLVLNIMGVNLDRSHERMFYAPAFGAALATAAGAFARETFEDGRSALFFDTDDGVTSAKVTALVQEPDALEAMAGAGGEVLASGQTWDHRVADILEQFS